MAEETKYRGIAVVLGTREYIVPSLSVRQYREHRELLSKPIEAKTDSEVLDVFDRYLPLIGVALRRNYPELSDDDLLDLLDLGNFREVLAAISGASGLQAVKAGEAAPVA